MTEPMPDILTLHATANPDKLAVIDDRPGSAEPLSLTFSELNRAANQFAHVLRDLGANTGDKVVWCGQNSIGVVIGMHGGRKAGVTVVPLNYRLTPEEAAYVVDNSDAVVVYVDAEFAELIDTIRPKTPKVREVLVFDGGNADKLIAEAPTDELPPAAEQAGTMIYTSGTTGNPKGAVRRGGADPQQAAALLGLIGYQPDDVYLTTGPLYHSGPGGFFGVAHTLGNTGIVQRKFDAEDWLRLVDKYKVTSTFAAPTPIRLVCSLPEEIKAKYDRSSMRIMIANAAPWSFALKKLYLADFPAESLFEVYGSTELGVDTVLEPKDQLRKPGSCGKAAPFVEIRLYDDDGNVVTEPNVPGEVYIRSASVFDTYHKAQDKYEEDTRGDFHTVGDVAYFDDEGFYYICDRKKDMIISGGMNIYPAEIEAALDGHDDIFDVAVFGIPSDEWGESVHAVVVARPGVTLTEADVTAYAREHLAGYKVPRSVSFTDELPRTGSGKLLKRVLREPFWAGHDTRVG